jgi:trimeric autotransporter adhesin
VTANAGGSATITAQSGSVSGSSTITVDASQLTSIQVSPSNASVRTQNGFAFQAIGTFADGKTQDLTTFAAWTSSDPSVATVNMGHALGLAPGTTTIVALFGGQAGTASLTVTSAARTFHTPSPVVTNLEQAASAGGVCSCLALALFQQPPNRSLLGSSK